MRKLRVFEKNKYSSINLLEKTVDEYEINKLLNNKINVQHNKPTFIKEDALKKELEHFLTCIHSKTYTLNNMHTAYNALKIAIQINDIIHNKHN